MKEALAQVKDFKITERIINKARFTDERATNYDDEIGLTLEGNMAWKSISTNQSEENI